MSECGCPLAELYAKAAQERDTITACAGKLQKELEEKKAELEEWKTAYNICHADLERERAIQARWVQEN